MKTRKPLDTMEAQRRLIEDMLFELQETPSSALPGGTMQRVHGTVMLMRLLLQIDKRAKRKRQQAGDSNSLL